MSETNAQAIAVEDAAKAVISLEGDFLRPLSVDLAQFREQPSVVSDPFDLRCYTTNRFIRSVDTYRGVLLKDLILKAGLRPEPPGEFKRTVFIAVARDGYAVTFSWHELFNTPVGERVIVAYECGGRNQQRGGCADSVLRRRHSSCPTSCQTACADCGPCLDGVIRNELIAASAYYRARRSGNDQNLWRKPTRAAT
jgi:hypothetical protein